MQLLTSSFARIALLVTLLAAAGCAGDADRFYPVRGTVVFEDGRPATELAGGSVTFVPSERPERGISSATINEDGTFILSCKKEDDGALAGKHQVEIAPPGIEDEDDNPKARRPRIRLDPTTAGQEITVEAQSNEITLKVKKAAAKSR